MIKNILSFLPVLLIFSACSKPCTIKHKLKDAPPRLALQERQTLYHVNWPLSVADKAKLNKYVTDKWIHLDLFYQKNMLNEHALNHAFKRSLPTIRHINHFHDAYQKQGSVRIRVSAYKALEPLGPNWYAAGENQTSRNHGYASACNLGAMLDDPYELKNTEPLGSIAASSLSSGASGEKS